jgi:type II secretory pathway component PulM
MMVITGIYALFWDISKSRNKKLVLNPVVVVHQVNRWLMIWSALQKKEETRNKIRWGLNLLKRVTSEVFQAAKARQLQLTRLASVHFIHGDPATFQPVTIYS